MGVHNHGEYYRGQNMHLGSLPLASCIMQQQRCGYPLPILTKCRLCISMKINLRKFYPRVTPEGKLRCNDKLVASLLKPVWADAWCHPPIAILHIIWGHSRRSWKHRFIKWIEIRTLLNNLTGKFLLRYKHSQQVQDYIGITCSIFTCSGLTKLR